MPRLLRGRYLMLQTKCAAGLVFLRRALAASRALQVWYEYGRVGMRKRRYDKWRYGKSEHGERRYGKRRYGKRRYGKSEHGESRYA